MPATHRLTQQPSMPAACAPGQPNSYFARHKYHGIPVNRNILPIDECRLHHCVGRAATVQKAIGVHILTPEHLWGTLSISGSATTSSAGNRATR